MEIQLKFQIITRNFPSSLNSLEVKLHVYICCCFFHRDRLFFLMISISGCKYINVCVHMHVHGCMHMHMHGCIHDMHGYIQVCVCVCVCVCACVRACMHACMGV